jgi:enolase-phosphatase E1
MQAVLTDIEGTTSSLSFVKDVLFPYARQHLPVYVRDHRASPRVAAIVDEVRRYEGDPSLDEQAVVDLLCRWIDEDRKITPLKTLQGYLWEEGYRAGVLQGHVYDDAVTRMREWRARGLRLYVFSSGSVAAQKLLFEHTAEGNLSPWFSGFFDTMTGPKREASSYIAIARVAQTPPAEILFLSDTVTELDAARAAGMRTSWVNREGMAVAGVEHREARSFDEVDPFLSEGPNCA